MRQLDLGEAQFQDRVDDLIADVCAQRLVQLERVRESHADWTPYPPIGVGTRVKYTRAFLKSILEPPRGRLWALESTVIVVGRRWLTIVRDDERDSMLVHPGNVQRVEIPDAETSRVVEIEYAGIFGFEPRLEGEEAEKLRAHFDRRGV